MTLNEWIIFGNVGASSKTMWAVVSGAVNSENIKKFSAEIPYDSCDFRRCYTLWKGCNLSDEDLRKIKDLCPIWKPFIDNWYELVRRYENDENVYDYLHKLRNEARLIISLKMIKL